MAKSRSKTEVMPAEQRSLLDAVITNADDDTPRLVYADWLEEHGEADRAELIRLQCRLSAEGADGVPERTEWEARVDHLLEEHGNAWAEDFLCRGVRHLEFRRGFVDKVSATGRVIAARGQRWCRRTPLRTLYLGAVAGVAGGVAEALAHGPLAQMWIDDARFEDSDLTALVTAPGRAGGVIYPSLVSLRITADGLPGSPGLADLAGSGVTPRLRYLSVEHTRVDAAGAAALAAATGLDELDRISLSHSAIGSEGLAALAASTRLPDLSSVELSFSRVTADFVTALAGLPGRRGLENLVLCGNPVADLDLDGLGEVLTAFPDLRIDLQMCPIPERTKEEGERRFGDRVTFTHVVTSRRDHRIA